MEAGGDEGVGEAAPRSSGITETAEGRSRGLTASGTIRFPHWGPRLTAPRLGLLSAASQEPRKVWFYRLTCFPPAAGQSRRHFLGRRGP